MLNLVYMTNLLSLSNNFIKHIPKEIEKLKNIEYFNISFNIINSLPKELATLNTLKSIHINNNPFYEIHIEIIHFFPKHDMHLQFLLSKVWPHQHLPRHPAILLN